MEAVIGNFVFNGGEVNGDLDSIVKNQFYAGCVDVELMDMEPYQIIQFYCGRGKMENVIKESKSGFDFAAVSSHSKVVNANRMRLHMLAYNLFNWFRRLVLPASMRKQQVDTIRLKLIKIAARAIHSARSITFKLCSSCPYKREFYRTLENIQQLSVQLK